jgi:hypothetical protein
MSCPDCRQQKKLLAQDKATQKALEDLENLKELDVQENRKQEDPEAEQNSDRENLGEISA